MNNIVKTLLEHNFIFLYILIPGFIIHWITYAYLPTNKSTGNIVYRVLIYGLLNFSIPITILSFFPTMDQYIKDNDPLLVFLFTFISPLIIASITCFILLNKKVRYFFDISPMPWDYYFFEKKERYAIIEFKDGKKIGGYYGKNSAVSNYPNDKEIYFEKEYVINAEGKFDELVDNSQGFFINYSEIKVIKFYN